MVEDKIFNNSFDNTEYGTERLTQNAVAIDPIFASRFEESTSENIEDLYTERRLRDILSQAYENSEFYEKYKDSSGKIERRDMFKIYYHFKDVLTKYDEFNIIQIFCAIAEFFDFNYRTLYKDVITLEDKAAILELIEEQNGLDKHVSQSKKLF